MSLTTLVCLMAATPQFSAPQAKTELVASTTGVEPGKPFSVALHMTMAPGWHSYYMNPGESGQATSIAWHLPAGFKAGPIRWAVPERLVVGGVAGYVYEKEVWLVTDITTPSALPNDEPVKLSADASWLLCREACVPQKSKLSIRLPLGPGEPNPGFAPALRGLAQAAPDIHVTASVKSKVADITVAEQFPIKGVEFFPADPAFFGAETAEIRSSSSGIHVRIPLSKYSTGSPTHIAGILVVPSGSTKGAKWIDVKVTEY